MAIIKYIRHINDIIVTKVEISKIINEILLLNIFDKFNNMKELQDLNILFISEI